MLALLTDPLALQMIPNLWMLDLRFYSSFSEGTIKQSCVMKVDREILFLSAAADSIIPQNMHSTVLAVQLTPIRSTFSAVIMKESMKWYFWNAQRWTLSWYLQNSPVEAKDIPDIFSLSVWVDPLILLLWPGDWYWSFWGGGEGRQQINAG